MRRPAISMLLAFALIFPFLSSLHAQVPWTPLDKPYGGTIYTFVQVGEAIVAGTESNGMYISTDEGVSWQPYGTAGAGLIPVAATAQGHVFAVTDDEGGVFRTTDNGTTWEQRASGMTGKMRYLTIAPSGDIFATTKNDLWRSTDEGGSWTNVLTDAENELAWISISPEGTILLTQGEDNDAQPIRRSTDNGATWQTLEEKASFASFAFAGAGEIFLATQDGILHSTDNGDSFTPFALAGYAVSSPFAFQRDAAGTLWLYATEEGLFRISSDGVTIQSLSSAPVGEGFNIFLTKSDALLLGYRGIGIWHSTDQGDSWEQRGLSKGAEIEHLVAAGPGTLLANIADGGLARSSDGGESWESLTVPVGRATILLAKGTGTIIAASADGILYHTTDGGTSWEGISSDFFLDGGISSKGTILLSSYIGLLRSTDDGNSWDTVIDDQAVTDLGFAPNGDIWGTTDASLFRSIDDGKTWTEVGFGGDRPDGADIEVTGNGTLLVGNRRGDGQILRSVDNGTTWAQEEYPCANGPEGHLWIGYGGTPYLVTNCGLFRSTDDGITWDGYAELPDGWWINALLFTSSGTIYAGTGHGLFKADELLSAPQNDESNAPERMALTVAPNPTGGSFAATFRLSEGGEATLVLYDMGGKEVSRIKRQHYSAGEHRVEWIEGEGISVGTYLLRLVTDDGTTSQRVEVVR